MLNPLFVVCFFFLSFTAAATAAIPVTDTSPIAIAPRLPLLACNTRARQPAYVVNELDDQYEVVRNADIRQTPSSNSRRIAELQRGSSVHVTGQLADKQWYQVRFAGMTGYIYAELLRKPVAEPAPKAKPAPAPKPKPIGRPTPQPVKVLPVRPGKAE